MMRVAKTHFQRSMRLCLWSTLTDIGRGDEFIMEMLKTINTSVFSIK